MLLRFKSTATAALLMHGTDGAKLLATLGKDSQLPGVLPVAEIPAALQALAEAIEADEQVRAAADSMAEPSTGDAATSEVGEQISLRVRWQPAIQMLRRCLREKADVVWGV